MSCDVFIDMSFLLYNFIKDMFCYLKDIKIEII